MKKNVTVTELQFGMYVAELDRPWTDTPFIFQGFILQTEEQLEILKKFCKSVSVDDERSRAVVVKGRDTQDGGHIASAFKESLVRGP